MSTHTNIVDTQGTPGGVMDYEHKLSKKICDAIWRMCQYHTSPFDTFLDHLLHFLHVEPIDKVCPHMSQIVGEFMQIWGSQMEFKGHLIAWYDMLGWMYEYYASNFKRKGMGQFFTPPHLCDFMVRSQGIEKADTSKGLVTISDPTCGSGRMLLAAGTYWMNMRGKDEYRYMDGLYLCANDLDYMCTKMTTINYVLHGLSGEVTCANGLMMDSDYRFGYQIRCIPIWKYCMEMYQRCARQVRDGVSYEEMDSLIAVAGKDKAMEVLLMNAEACRIGKHYDKYMPQMVRNKIQWYICYSDIDKTTYFSPPGSDSIHIIKKITKEESFQVAVERNMWEENRKKKEKAKMNEQGTGLFADIKINQNVIKVKKAKQDDKILQAVKKKKSINKPPSDGGQQTSLF